MASLIYGRSSVGRASVSKTECREFEPFRPCLLNDSRKMKIVDYVKESYTELKEKVSWPTWKELRSSVIVVSIASLIIALAVFLMDISFKNLLELFYQNVHF